MTLELFSYILFCIFALYYAYKESKVSETTTLKAIVAFFIGVIWFFIVRISGFDIDINTYAGYLDNITSLLFINSSYFLREFVFWGIFIGGNFFNFFFYRSSCFIFSHKNYYKFQTTFLFIFSLTVFFP